MDQSPGAAPPSLRRTAPFPSSTRTAAARPRSHYCPCLLCRIPQQAQTGVTMPAAERSRPGADAALELVDSSVETLCAATCAACQGVRAPPGRNRNPRQGLRRHISARHTSPVIPIRQESQRAALPWACGLPRLKAAAGARRRSATSGPTPAGRVAGRATSPRSLWTPPSL
jgi:hypothetical protein